VIYLGNDAIIIAPSSGTATNSPVPYSSTIGEYDIGSSRVVKYPFSNVNV